MSIIIKTIQNSKITSPNDNYVKLFSNKDDDGILYYKDSKGVCKPVGELPIPFVESISYNELYKLASENNMVAGTHYLITDFESIYEQPDYYVDGTLKTKLQLKGKPKHWGYQPLLVEAISPSDISVDAYQISYIAGGYSGFTKDKIKYDFKFNRSEFNRRTKGRIFECVDEFNNRTDYDHRTILFRRYQNYIMTDKIGEITNYNCVTGEIVGDIKDIKPDDIIIVDTFTDLGYNIGLKIIDDSHVVVDNLYTNGVPLEITLNNKSKIIPINYSFEKKYDCYLAKPSGDYTNYREVYFGQGDSEDYIELFTFDNGYNNVLGNYSHNYNRVINNVLLLPNNVFGMNAHSNIISDDFSNNTIGINFNHNTIKCIVSGVDFTNATYVYHDMNCDIFKGKVKNRLSFYDESDNINIVDITD